MIRRCDNHYSLALIGLQFYKDSESVLKWHVLGVCIENVGLSRSEVLIFVLLNSVNTSYKFLFKAENNHIIFVITINCGMLFL